MFDLFRSLYITQLFNMHENCDLALAAAKVVEDIKIAGKGDIAKRIIEKFNNHFQLQTVSHGLKQLGLFGIYTTQNGDFTPDTKADDKPNARTEYSLARADCKQPGEPLNSIQKSFFRPPTGPLDGSVVLHLHFACSMLPFATKGSEDKILQCSLANEYC